ncbi:MAG: hypoxanthine phosphoribosyltransferase, partial [Oscillospiraceae bacterium]|nr:hypoxanthine phosphoribosyltransferase [Oscillospiraceae bacterium]
DLARCLTVPAELNFIKVHTYVGTESKLLPEFELGRNIPVKGQQVLILEDIVDTGRTMDCVVRHYYESGAKSVEICAMLDKKTARAKGYEQVVPKYAGFEIENQFVVGFGLDCDEKFRLLPDVCVYHPDSKQS